MDLAELLTREGYIPTDIPALLSWAHDRAGVLIAGLDDASPLRGLLAGPSGQVPAVSPRPAPASAPAPAKRPGKSTLTVELEDLAEADAPVDLRSAVAAATAPHPVAAEPEPEPDSGFGGFARFGGMARMNRPYPIREETRTEERPTLARSFALAVEHEAKPVEEKKPPSTTGELSSALPVATLNMSAEESGGLVLGIPDEESADVPVPRLGSNSVPNRRFVVAEPEPTASPGLSDSSVALANLTESFDPAADSGKFIAATPAARPVAQEPVGVDLRAPIPARREQTGPREAAAVTSEDPSDPQAPVIRHRNPKKKVVELGAPIARPHVTSATAKVVPRPEPSSRINRKTPPPPPPGPLRRTPPPMIDEDIQELSRVEVLDELPAYLRDDED